MPPALRHAGARATLLRFWALDYGYVLRWQVMSALRRLDPERYLTPRAPRRRPVLILPGILETWDFLRPVVDLLYARGHPVHVVTALGRNLGSVPAMAEIVERYLADHDLSDVVIVAHSKGGLIGKYVMAHARCGGRVASMVAVNTPFGGSRHARYIPTPAIRIFLPTDPTLRVLAEALAVNARITSIASRWDPHIPEGSAVVGAVNLTLDDVGHFRLMGCRSLHEAVLAAVDPQATVPPGGTPSLPPSP